MKDLPATIEDSQRGIVKKPTDRIEPFDAKSVSVFLPEAALKTKSGKPKKWTAGALTDVLNEICNTGVMYRACHAHALSFTQLWKLRKEFAEVTELVEMATDYYRQKISHVVHDRAVNGWDEPVYFKGECVGHVRKFSDRLLELQAKRHVPEYRDKSQVDHNVSGGILMIPTAPVEDKEAYLEKLRNRKVVASQVVD